MISPWLHGPDHDFEGLIMIMRSFFQVANGPDWIPLGLLAYLALPRCPCGMETNKKLMTVGSRVPGGPRGIQGKKSIWPLFF